MDSMIYAFSGTRIDVDRFEIRRDGEVVAVEPQVFDVLVYLLERRDRVVTKEELLDELWGDRFVSESTLTSRIAAARNAVGDDGRRQEVIRTAHRRGYRFVADLEPTDGSGEPAPSAARLPPRPSAGDATATTAFPGLIGRSADLDATTLHLSRSRLVTLTGPGGVGKTTLAQALRKRLQPADHPDGSWFVELVSVGPSAVAEAVATTLDVQRRKGLSVQDSLLDYLANRTALLVLDNCEHVIGEVAALVASLLEGSPELRILATSRESLQIGGEQVYPVGPLAWQDRDDGTAPPAMQLFEVRARAVDPAFTLNDENRRAVANVCARLDGIPLAIELAAARTRTLDLTQLTERLDERFRLLKGERREGDRRHRTLVDTIGWSYDLLDADSRQLFCQLSVFTGPFDLTALEAVCETEGDVVDEVTGLIDRSMVSVRSTDSTNRFEVLESLRAYGDERLPDDDRTRVSARHCAHYVDLADRTAAGLDSSNEDEWRRTLDGSFENLRTAHAHAVATGDADAALSIVAGIREYAMRAMRYEVMSWATESLAVASEEHHLYPTALGLAAYGSFLLGDYAAAVDGARRARQLEQERGVQPSGMAERVLANCCSLARDFAGLEEECRRQLELAEASEQPARIAHAAYFQSAAYSSIGRPGDAAAAAETARRAAAASGSPTALAGAEYALALVSLADDRDEARRRASVCHELAESVGNRWMSAFGRTLVGSLSLLGDDIDTARTELADVLDIWYRSGDWSQTWLALNQSLVALERLDRPVDAAAVIGAVQEHASIGAAPSAPDEQTAMFDAVERVRGLLGDDRYDALSAAGGETPLGDLVVHTRRALVRE